ncbi:tetratricopeptide repeat protein [Fulvivirga lutimaris]|uniref:tetratricopeptide repeat protein n=1 Tax=Fulvivirga lutimaris TaxID=1819566 RepID=UPI0012BD296A|nr:tetratricopeptide repeat protein [Fulvivirga lutimaris]MTI38025.1 tetratricopeptide repeat protein [Fulvivirga lutimaris]
MKNAFILFFALAIISCSNENSKNGDKFFSNGEYDKAVEAYTVYLNTEPRDIKTIYNRGRAYEELGKYELALKDFNRVIKEDPLNVNAHLSIMVDYYDRLNDYENTIFYAEKVLKLDETNANAFTLKGKAHQKLGQLPEALSAYNAAISVDKEYAEAYLSRGALRIYTKQTSRACSDFRMAQTLGVEKADELLKKYCR